MDKKVQDILSKMTLEEKISLCNGADFWHSKAMEQYDIPAITMSDGPHGVRCQKDASDMLGVNRSEPATCFPTAVTSGATWDAALLKAEGKAIGGACRHAGRAIEDCYAPVFIQLQDRDSHRESDI